MASLIQRGSVLTAVMGCSGLLDADLNGTIDTSDGSFSLSGTDSYAVQWDMAGTFTTYRTASGTVGLRGEQLASEETFTAIQSPQWRGMVSCPSAPPILPKFDTPRGLSSLDAELILQFDAGLTDSLPCLWLGDVNLDRTVDAVDALLVLQYTARLIEHFPPY